MTETKTQKEGANRLDIGCLEFIWNLVLGIWNFNTVHSAGA